MFTVLFAINMVANRYLGWFNTKVMFVEALSSASLTFSKSDGFKENKATSDPDIKAEQTNKTIIIIKLTSISTVKGLTKLFNKILEYGKGSSNVKLIC